MEVEFYYSFLSPVCNLLINELICLFNILIDLREINTFDVENVHIFADIYKLCAESGGKLVLVNPSNKIKGIRAVVCSDTTSARFSRLHNNANILCFGERIIGEYLAKDICDIWLNTEFEAERHANRVNLIEQ